MSMAEDRADKAWMAPRHRLEFCFTASPEGVRAALTRTRAFLAAAGTGAEACGTGEIVMAEALNNVAEHGYDMSGDGLVRLALSLHGARLTAEIMDEGAPLPGLCPPPGHAPAVDGCHDDLPEGGFGWFLIHSLTDALRYRRQNGRNHLHLEMDLGPRHD